MISLGNVRNARSHTCRRMVWLDGLSTPSVRRLRAQTLSWNHARHHGALSQEAPTWEHEKSPGVVCTLTGESHPLNCALMTIRNGPLKIISPTLSLTIATTHAAPLSFQPISLPVPRARPVVGQYNSIACYRSDIRERQKDKVECETRGPRKRRSTWMGLSIPAQLLTRRSSDQYRGSYQDIEARNLSRDSRLVPATHECHSNHE